MGRALRECGNALIMKTHSVTAPRGPLSSAQSDFPVAPWPLYKGLTRWSVEFTNDDISVSRRLWEDTASIADHSALAPTRYEGTSSSSTAPSFSSQRAGLRRRER